MISAVGIMTLLLNAAMASVGIVVLRDSRHRRARKMLAGAIVAELVMALGLLVQAAGWV